MNCWQITLAKVIGESDIYDAGGSTVTHADNGYVSIVYGMVLVMRTNCHMMAGVCGDDGVGTQRGVCGSCGEWILVVIA